VQHGPTAPSRSAPSRPRATRVPQAGELIEARVAQLWFWEGFYSRRGIDLQHHFAEPLQITDLDLLAFDFSPQLSRSKHIGEVKTGTGKSAAKPLDRLIWLRGLREVVGAESAELTIAHAPSDRTRQLARTLGMVAQSLDDFERRELETVGPMADLGAHGEGALRLTYAVHETCRHDQELERAFWFLRSEVWFLEPFTATKQLIDALRRLRRRWTPRSEDEETNALRWLSAEAVSVLTLNLVTIAGFSFTLDRPRFSAFVSERLAEGVVPIPQMRRISESVDRYVAGILKTTGVPADVRTEAMGAFLPQPPDYAEPLAETAWRIGRTPLQARSLPRQIDFLLHERIANRREPRDSAVRRLGLTRHDAIRLRALTAAFLRGCDASSELIDAAFVTPLAGHFTGEEFTTPTQELLLDQNGNE
jgi:hypothetical protein